MSYGDNIETLVAERDAWIKDFGIDWGSSSYIYDELTQAERVELEKLDKKRLVWTNASTCDGEYFMPGMHEFDGESGCGCWESYGFYVAKKPWKKKDEYNFVTAVGYIPCPVCNADGDGDGEEGCEGPAELPATEYGIDIGDGCEEGQIQVYLD